MTGWYLVWMLVIRAGSDFVIIPDEKPMSSFDACTHAKIELEKDFTENPPDWGDFTSFSIDCEHRKEG